MSDGSYYAKEMKVWRKPKHTKNGDGSTSISMGFYVCKVSNSIGYEGAKAIAESLNKTHKID